MKNFFTLLIISFISVGLSSCASPPHKEFNEVKPGMDKHDVLQLLGSPARTRRHKDHDEWYFRFYVDNDRRESMVRFRQGLVVDKSMLVRKDPSLLEIEEADTPEEYQKAIEERREHTKFKDIENE